MTDQPNRRCGCVGHQHGGYHPGTCECCQPDAPSGAGDARPRDLARKHMAVRGGHEEQVKAHADLIIADRAAISAESAAEVERLTAELREARQVAAEDEVALVNLANRAQAAEQRLREVEDERGRLLAVIEASGGMSDMRAALASIRAAAASAGNEPDGSAYVGESGRLTSPDYEAMASRARAVGEALGPVDGPGTPLPDPFAAPTGKEK